MKMKRLLSVILAAAIIICSAPLSDSAVSWLFGGFNTKAKAIEGSCGYELFWEYDWDSGCLTISGYGEMFDCYDEYDTIFSWAHDSLRKVIIDAQNVSIGNYAFANCELLSSIEISSHFADVTSIGDSAFLNCTSLSEFTFPRWLESIGERAFYNTGLESVIIPGSVSFIGDGAFSGCNNLESIAFSDNFNWYYWIKNNSIIERQTNKLVCACKDTVIDSSVKSIGSYAFGGFSNLESIEIPDGVTSIGKAAFKDCTGLTSIDLPDSLTRIENYFGIVADEYAPRIHIQQKNGPQHTKAVMIRTKEYKYVLRLYETDEFYDLKKGEEHNLIDDPQYKEIIADLRSKLLEWLFETSDNVPFDKDKRFPDDFYLETINAFLKFRISPLIKGAMKLTGNDFQNLAQKGMKLFKIDTNKFYKK